MSDITKQSAGNKHRRSERLKKNNKHDVNNNQENEGGGGALLLQSQVDNSQVVGGHRYSPTNSPLRKNSKKESNLSLSTVPTNNGRSPLRQSSILNSPNNLFTNANNNNSPTSMAAAAVWNSAAAFASSSTTTNATLTTSTSFGGYGTTPTPFSNVATASSNNSLSLSSTTTVSSTSSQAPEECLTDYSCVFYTGANISDATTAELARRSRRSPYVAQRELIPIGRTGCKTALKLAKKIGKNRLFDLEVMAEMFWDSGTISAVSDLLPTDALYVPSIDEISNNRAVYSGRSPEDGPVSGQATMYQLSDYEKPDRVVFLTSTMGWNNGNKIINKKEHSFYGLIGQEDKPDIDLDKYEDEYGLTRKHDGWVCMNENYLLFAQEKNIPVRGRFLVKKVDFLTLKRTKISAEDRARGLVLLAESKNGLFGKAAHLSKGELEIYEVVETATKTTRMSFGGKNYRKGEYLKTHSGLSVAQLQNGHVAEPGAPYILLNWRDQGPGLPLDLYGPYLGDYARRHRCAKATQKLFKEFSDGLVWPSKDCKDFDKDGKLYWIKLGV